MEKRAWRISYTGREFTLPLPGSEARPLRLSMRAEHDLPIYLRAPAVRRL
ncbi:hypothetical protein [Streptomyces inhibens]